MTDTVPREFVTLWVSESFARQRVNLEALSHFVGAVSREVHRWTDEARECGEIDVACALLPNGRLLVDAQFAPLLETPDWLASLRQRLGQLPLPPVRRLPVAFSCRVPVGQSVGTPPGAFRIPFAAYPGEWRNGSMERLILSAAAREGLWESVDDVDLLYADQVTRLPSDAHDSHAHDSEHNDSEHNDSNPGDSDAHSGVAGLELDLRPRTTLAARRGIHGRHRWNLWWRRWSDRFVRWLSVVRACLTATRLARAHRDPAQSLSGRADSDLSDRDLDETRGAISDSAQSGSAPATVVGSSSDTAALGLITPKVTSEDRGEELNEIVERWRQTGDEARETGDLARAIEAYSQILELAPDDDEAWLARGAVRCIAGETRAGLDDFNRLLHVDPSHVAARYNRGILLMELEAYEAAIEDFTFAMESDPWSPRLWVARGRARALVKDFTQAMADFTTAIRLDPHDDEPYALRAACARFVLEFPESARQAIADYDRALEIDPRRVIYLVQRAEQRWVVDDYADALADCNRALELDPEFHAARGLRGAVYLALDDHARAEEDATAAIDQLVAAPNVYLTRAEARIARDDWEGALEDVESTLAAAPEMAAAWKCRSLIRLRLGQPEDALADLSEAIRLAPEQASLWCHRAALYRHQKQPELALPDCAKALELSPDFAPALLIRAGCREDLDQREQALEDLDRLVELAPDDLQVRLERASFWLRSDDFERALVDFSAALSIEPDNLTARFHRGQILAAQGDVERALLDLSRAIELDPQFAPAYARRANVWLMKGERAKADADYGRAEELDPDEAEQFRLMRWVDEAHYHLQLGDVDASLAAASAALEVVPDHPPAVHARAMALIGAEEFVDALGELDRLREVMGDSPSLAIFRGHVLGELGEFDAARVEFDRALEELPDTETSATRGTALAGRAFARAGLDDWDGADADFSLAVVHCPESGWLYYQQGRVYLQRRQHEAARCCFRQSLHADQPKLNARQRERVEAFLRRQPSDE